MTEYEYILADLVLLKMPKGQPFTFNGMFHNILIGKYDDYPQQTIDELNKLLISNTSSIRTFLRPGSCLTNQLSASIKAHHCSERTSE